MANRYWVGGTASWDGTAGTKWALTSGGTGGEAVPTTADDVFFDGSSTGTITVAAGNTGCKSITCTGFTGTLTGSAALTIAGGFTLVSGMTFSCSGVWTITGTGTLISAGKSIPPLTINGSGITVTQGDAISLRSSSDFTLVAGTYNANNFNFTTPSGGVNVSGTSTRTLTMGTGTWTLGVAGTNAWNASTTTNLTLTASCTLSMTSGSAKTFSGGDFNYSGLTLNQGGAGRLTISGSNTFNSITNTYSATGATSIRFTSGTTTTVSDFTAGGTAGKILTIDASTTSAATLSKSSGTVNVDYVSISYSTATGGATWNAGANSTNVGNNSGWIFAASPSSGRFLMLF